MNTQSIKRQFQLEIQELKRPWKLFSLICGLILLVWGSFIYQAPDWDIPICFIMAIFTYLTASYSLHIVAERRYSEFPIMLFFYWFAVDGCYSIYWIIKDIEAWRFMRPANFGASSVLYWLCALIWYPRCDLKDYFKKYLG